MRNSPSNRKMRHQNKRRRCPSPPASPTNSPPPANSPPLADPFPGHRRPTGEECAAVRDALLSFHGFPQQFAKFRRRSPPTAARAVEEEESVLDGLVQTLLSQNTTDSNSARAFASLKSAFPTWEHVLAADSKCVEEAIKCGGLAATKTSCIQNLLRSLVEKRGKLCLEYLRGLSIDEVKSELGCFKGIGPKTVACVLMFQLQRDDFPVDTHVFRIAKAIGWVPSNAGREKTYLHLNRRIPDELKFDLNCLFVTHGKICKMCTCSSNDASVSCPIANYYIKTEK